MDIGNDSVHRSTCREATGWNDFDKAHRCGTCVERIIADHSRSTSPVEHDPSCIFSADVGDASSDQSCDDMDECGPVQEQEQEWETCPTCKGQGKYTCFSCHGDGIRLRHQVCMLCKGAGRGGSAESATRWSCAECRGNGFRILKSSCDECAGLGRGLHCRFCHGLGGKWDGVVIKDEEDP